MARGKKKETLTPEERLQAALIPESEQPYKVPENWCWIRISDIAQILNGFAFKSQMYADSGIRIIRISNVQDGYIEDDKPVFYPLDSQDFIKSFMLRDRDLLMSLTGNVGRVAIIDNSMLPAALNQRVACIRMLNPDHNKCFLFYYFLRKEFIQDCIKNSKGSAQLNMSTEWLKGYPIPLPPLAEQQRIIDRIESLFAKLDEAKQKAQDALDSFETRKAAILHKAFTGELTAQWRKEHGVGMESWENSTVGQVCHDVKVGIVIKPSQYYTDEEKGTPAFRSANVRENRIDDFDWVYLNHTGMENNSRSIVHTGDVLVVRSGNPGTACVVSEKFDGYNAIDILIAVPDHRKISSEFLCAYTNSPFGKNLIFENKRGMALAHFNVKGYSGLPIRVPQLNEQAKIIRILDDLLAKEQQAKEAAEGVLEQIDLIKKSILARAFRGELGTNDPSEESAVFLLKEIISTTQKKLDSSPKRQSVKRQIPVEIQMQLTTAIQEKLYRFILENPHCTVEKATSIEKDVLKVAQALRELQSKALIVQHAENNTLTVVV